MNKKFAVLGCMIVGSVVGCSAPVNEGPVPGVATAEGAAGRYASGDTTGIVVENTEPVVIDTIPVEEDTIELVIEDDSDIDDRFSVEASSLVAMLHSGDFASVVEMLDDNARQSVDEMQLQEVWLATVSALGEYIGTDSSYTTDLDEYYIVNVVEEFEDSGLNIEVTFNKETGQVAGLFLRYEAIAVTGDFFVEEEIVVVSDERYPLGGVLTTPVGVENPPVVVLVQGSGSTDRDQNISGNTPFRDIAHGLAEMGIATLRYDKRFYTYPQAYDGTAALREEVLDDVNAAIELLRGDERVNADAIYVLGHSLGGMLAPNIALENEDVKGLIIMAGTPRQLYELSYDQIQDVVAMHPTDDAMELYLQQVESELEILGGDMSDVDDNQILLGIPAIYHKSVQQYVGVDIVNQVDVPMLILQGSEDFQVFAETDFVLWQELLEDRDNVEFKLYDGLNHLMMESNGLRDLSEYSTIGEVSSDVVRDIANFIVGDIDYSLVVADYPMPLDNTFKLIVAMAYADQVGAGTIDPATLVNITDLEQFYIANFEDNAHLSWLDYIHSNNLVQNDAVTLREIAKGMMMFNSNTNTDFLLNFLGLDTVNQLMVDLAPVDNTEVYPIVSTLLVADYIQDTMLLPNGELFNALFELSDDEYVMSINEINLLIDSDEFASAPLLLSDLELQNRWNNRFIHASDDDYIKLLELINSRSFFNDDARQELSFLLGY